MSTPAPTFLGLDAGASATKWATLTGGRLSSGRSLPLTAHLFQPQRQAELEQALSSLRQALPGPAVAGVHLGLSGLGLAQRAHVQTRLAQAFGLSPAQVTVEDDLALAYRCHFPEQAGLLLYAGTGSVAYHLSAVGEVFRAGGRGYLLGDEGGGFSLGQAALRWVSDHLDRGQALPDGPLRAELSTLTGGLTWEALRSYTYQLQAQSAVAALAPAVGRSADAGDPDAKRLLIEAAQALAALAGQLRQQRASFAVLPVVATGGAFKVSSLFGHYLEGALPGVTLRLAEHAQGAARLACASYQAAP